MHPKFGNHYIHNDSIEVSGIEVREGESNQCGNEQCGTAAFLVARQPSRGGLGRRGRIEPASYLLCVLISEFDGKWRFDRGRLIYWLVFWAVLLILSRLNTIFVKKKIWLIAVFEGSRKNLNSICPQGSESRGPIMAKIKDCLWARSTISYPFVVLRQHLQFSEG